MSFDDPRISEAEQVTINGDRQQLERLYGVVVDRLQNYLSSSFRSPLKVDDTISESESELSLRSLDFINHQLVVNFSDNNSVGKINLTTVQLFDLITALEAYNKEISNLSLQEKSKPGKNLLIWGSCAAAAILVIGLATVGIRNSRQPEPEVASSSEPKSSKTIPEFETVVPPKVSNTEQPIAEPQPNEPISSATKLPPPLPVDVPKPQPDIPDPADYPPSQPLDLSALEPPVSPADQTETINVVPETALEPQADSPTTNPSPSNNEPAITSLPGTSKIDEPSAIDEPFDRQNNNFSQSPPETQKNPGNSDLALNSSSLQNQLQQVNRYFQENWQPPEQLTETIEYRLVINSDGAIARIFPIGKAAEVYLDRTNIPLMGETFIDPSSGGQNLTVRLMLSPDGEVATFAE